MARNDSLPAFQRNALVPGLLAAAILFAAPALIQAGWGVFVLYTTAILALIVGWFAQKAKQWWWVIVFVIVALLWNPISPFAFDGSGWVIAQPIAAVVFIVASVLIKTPRVTA